MAMKCEKCGGIIPDICIGESGIFDMNDCKNHTKPEVNINYGDMK